MKIPASRRNSGFTLVELLVVIAIIAVLAAAGFAAGNAAIQKARKTTALATASALETSVNNFFTEYGTMPKENLSGDAKVSSESDEELLHELLGYGTSLKLNTRGVKFLSVRETKTNVKKNGLFYADTTPKAIYDPWGGPFSMMLDGDYDEKIVVAPSGGGGATLNGRRVAVWSDGADYKDKNKSGDDVKTW